MKINIYAIKSSLHDEEYIRSEREKLLLSLKDLTNYVFNYVEDVTKFYNDADLSLILIESGGSENEFLKNFKYFKAPYRFLTYSHNNSLPAALEILTYLQNNSLKGEILHGENDYIAKRIIEICNNETKPSYLGVIGKPSDWLISSSSVDNKILKDKFNIELVNISTKELIDEYKKHNEDLAPELFNATFDYEELKKAYHIYLALRNLVNKYSLKGLTIRCFDLLDTVKSTSCLALALLNDEGIIGGCEGDIGALISMFLIRKILHKPSFMANPSYLNFKNNELVLAHCTIPLKMTTSYKFNTHFESNIGIGIKGELDTSKTIYIFRISSLLDSYVLLKGNIEENLNKFNLCRTQIRIRLNSIEDINYFLTKPLGNHHMVFYSDDENVKELINYLSILGLKKINN